LQRIYKAIQLSVLVGAITGIAWLQKGPQHRSQIKQALLAGKDWLMSKA
jgi:hypothetical protein